MKHLLRLPLLLFILSAGLWAGLSFVYQPSLSPRTTCLEQSMSLTFLSEDPALRYGYPLVFASSTLQCSGPDGGYSPYTVKPAALMADIAIWVSSTAVIMLAITGVRRSYRTNGWAKTTSPARMLLIAGGGITLSLLLSVVPHESSRDGMRCYSGVTANATSPALPYQHGFPLVFYEQNLPACSSYRWVEAPNVCGGNCLDYPGDPSHIYGRPLAIDLALGVLVAAASYMAIRCIRHKK